MCEICRGAQVRVQEMRDRLTAMRPKSSVQWKSHDALKARIRQVENELLRLQRHQHDEGTSLKTSSGKNEGEDPLQRVLPL